MADMLRASRLQRIIEAEDAARALRNRLDISKRGVLTPLTANEGRELADALVQGLQAIREML